MPAKKLPTLSNAEEFEFRFTPSGHGQAGEFTPGIHYYLKLTEHLLDLMKYGKMIVD